MNKMTGKYDDRETSIDCPILTEVIPGQKANIHAIVYFENSLDGDFEPTGYLDFWCESQDKCRVPILGTGGVEKEGCYFWQNKLQFLENFNY